METEKTLKEHSEKVDEETKAAIEEAKEALKTALDGDDVEDITAKVEALTQASMKLGEEIYKAQAEAGDSSEAADSGEDSVASESDDVVDADFEEVNENKDDK